MSPFSYNEKATKGNNARVAVKDDGSMRTIRSVMRQLKRMGYNADDIWREIRIVVAKTLIAISPELKVDFEAEIPSDRPGPTCFQVH